MPLKNQLHVDQLLSQISVKYMNSDYIADKIFPTVSVRKDSDLFRIYDRDFGIPDTQRANKGVANQWYFEVSTASYILQDHAIKDYISDDDIDNYDIADLRADTVEELTDVIMRQQERTVCDLFTTTNWSLNVSLAAANAWNLSTQVSNPIPIVDTGATEILENSGQKANYMVLNREAFTAVKNHTSVLDRTKYTTAAMTEEIMAGLFDVPEFMVSTAVRDESQKGVGPSITAMWGDVAFLGYKPARPGPKAPSAGYIFRKDVPMVRRWRDEERNAEAIEVRNKYQARIVASLSGFLIKDVI